MGWRRTLQSYFGFSQRETNALLVLVPLLVLAMASAPLYEMWRAYRQPDFSEAAASLDSALANWEYTAGEENARDTVYAFDPNKASLETLTEIGFRLTIARRIVAYRNKGGQFRIKKDLLKIYGMDAALYDRLVHHITLPNAYRWEKKQKAATTQRRAPVKRKAIVPLDINQCDEAAFKAVRGIGEVLSARIVKFRDKLGGFVGMHQLYEVYGLDSSLVASVEKRFFVGEGFVPGKIRVNSASRQELASHPYLDYRTAKAIIAYRFQHGPYTSVDDIAQSVLVSDSVLQRIRPYVALE